MAPVDAQNAVEELVRRTQTLCRASDSESVRRAYERVLRELEVDAASESWRDGVDVVGAAYMRLLSTPYRRTRGQVFTPTWAARLMTEWALDGVRAGTLLDPGCGSGVLLLAAARARESRRVRLVGVDVDSIAVLMTRVNAALRGLAIEARWANFLLDELGERPIAIVCNPPYTRHHALERADKEAITQSLGERLGFRLSRVASLHALFLARALEVAADGARIAFVTPAQWLDTNYGREVKAFLETQAHIAAVIDLDPEFFPNARTSAAITLIEKRPSTTQPARLSVGARPPEPSDVLARLTQLQEENVGQRPRAQPRRDDVQLRELARVHRGVATGHNRFFVLSDRDRRNLGLAKSYLKPCIASPRLIEGTMLTADVIAALPDEKPSWLLAARMEPQRGPLADYLAEGRALGVDQRHLCRQRRPWFAIRWRGTFPILFSYLNKDNPRFVRNLAGAVPLNTWLVVEPKPGVDADELFQALSEPRIVEQAAGSSRHYGDRLWKLEPSEVERLLVKDVRIRPQTR